MPQDQISAVIEAITPQTIEETVRIENMENEPAVFETYKNGVIENIFVDWNDVGPIRC